MNINFDFDGRVAVAVSGGADSVALLHLASHASRLTPYDVIVLHVNHKLRPSADTESAYVKSFAQSLGLKCVVFEWMEDKPSVNLESVARDVRYKFMTDWCKKNDVEILMTAHQADDQIETFLMNLSRGSGVYGLAAMRSGTMRDGIKIIRPLLNVFRRDLEKYCTDNNLKYFNDEMNDDEKYTRVRIRKNRYLLRDKLEISDDRILLAIKNLSRARDALEKINNEQLTINNSDRVEINANVLFAMPNELQLRFFGETLRRVGGAEYSPRLGNIERLIKKIQTDTVATSSHCFVRRLGDKILIVPEGTSISFRKKRNEKSKTKI